jgi:hypothetical protein
MSSAKIEIGQDIESLCNKCGDVWHVVVAVVNDKIAKVECKQCHGVHRYKDPRPPAAKKKPARVRSTAKKGTKAAAKLLIEADLSKPVRDYQITGMFEPGDRIHHSTFGDGVVQNSPAPGKIEIIFGTERKLLAQARPPTRGFSR